MTMQLWILHYQSYLQHEEICGFPSIHFYNGKLKTDESVKHRKNFECNLPFWPRGRNKPMIFCDFVGEEVIAQGRSRSNPREAEKVVSDNQFKKFTIIINFHQGTNCKSHSQCVQSWSETNSSNDTLWSSERVLKGLSHASRYKWACSSYHYWESRYGTNIYHEWPINLPLALNSTIINVSLQVMNTE